MSTSGIRKRFPAPQNMGRLIAGIPLGYLKGYLRILSLGVLQAMALSPVRLTPSLPPIRWEKLPEDFPLPDGPVESTLQPLLAAALREALELSQLIPDQALIASNFGLCSTVEDKVVVKAAD